MTQITNNLIEKNIVWKCTDIVFKASEVNGVKVHVPLNPGSQDTVFCGSEINDSQQNKSAIQYQNFVEFQSVTYIFL